MATGQGYIFFNIQVPAGEVPRKWAERHWAKYGFDYDPKRSNEHVLAWPLEDSDMEVALAEDGIKFTTFEADDLESFFS